MCVSLLGIFALLLPFVAERDASASSLTVTTLSAVPVTPVGSGIFPETTLRITADVTNNGSPVTTGSVSLCEDTVTVCTVSSQIGGGQLISSGTSAGSFLLSLHLSAGDHRLKAFYAGTLSEAPSVSPVITIRVGQHGLLPTTTTINATATGNGIYTLTGTVSGFSSLSVGGSVTFIDQSNGGQILGTGTVGSSTNASGLGAAVSITHNATTPAATVVADFNLDGFSDIATFTTSGGTLSLGTGNGSFASPSSIFSQGPVLAASSADFNGDGSPDLAVIVHGSPDILTILLGNGDGTFAAAAQTYALSNGAVNLLSGDLNADGITDLLVSSLGDETVTPLLGDGTGGFSLQSSIAVGAQSQQPVLGDFNHDGYGDIALSNDSAGTITVLLGGVSGSFTFTPAPLSPYSVGMTTGALTEADLNNDGWTDLAIVSGTNVVVYLADSQHPGQFLAPGSFSLPAPITSMTAGQLTVDGLGNLFLVAGSSVYVLEGSSSGALSIAATTSIPSSATLTAVDINSDGVEDVLAVLNNGTMQYLPGQVIQVASVTSTGVTMPGGGTYNVTASYSGTTVYSASQSSAATLVGMPVVTTTTLSSSPAGIVAAGQTLTLNASVTPDATGSLHAGGNIVFSEGSSTLATVPIMTNGTASFSFPAVLGAHMYTATYSGDVNFTGSTSTSPLEIFVPFATSTALSVAPGQTPTFGDVSTLTASVNFGGTPVPAGEVNFCIGANACTGTSLLGTAQIAANGIAVLRLRLPVQGLGVANNAGITARFVGTHLYAPSNSAVTPVTVTRNPLLADTLTLTLTPSPNSNPTLYRFEGLLTAGSILLPTGTLTFVDTTNQNLQLASTGLMNFTPVASISGLTSYPVHNNPTSIASGDFNEDGFTDFAVANDASSNVSLLLNDASGALHPSPNVFATGLNPNAIVTGDFNGDGHLDIATVNNGSNTVTLLLGNGSGSFTSAPAISTGTSPIALAEGDFNNDGHPDLAVVDFLDNDVRVLINNGSGGFLSGSMLPFGSAPLSIATTDVNRDGLTDLIVGEASGALRTFFAMQDGSFSAIPSSSLTTTTTPAAMTVADVDMDGAVDIAVADFLGSTAQIYYGDGAGAFVLHTTLSTGASPDVLRIGDFNGDGLPDIVTLSNAGISIFANSGSRSFQSLHPFSLSPADGTDIALGQIDGDGLLDAAVTLTNNTVIVPHAQYSISASGSPGERSVFGGGTHSIVAKYPGDENYQPATSPVFSVTGSLIPTTTTLSGNMPFAVGATPQIKASVAPTGGSFFNYSLGGSVTFSLDGTVVCSAVPLQPNGTATCTLPALLGGTHTVHAVYSGDANFQTSASVQDLQGIASPLPLTVTWHPAPLTYGDPLGAAQLDATVSPSVPGSFLYTPSVGTVLASGMQMLSVTFTPTDLTSYLPATAHTSVTVAKRVLTVQADSFTIALGQTPPALTASYSNFANGDNATVITGKPQLTLNLPNPANAGAYPITIANGSLSASNYSFSLLPGALTISRGTDSTALSGPTLLNIGSTGTYAATVSSSASHIPATGNVSFFDGPTNIGMVPLSTNGTAALPLSFPAAGMHAITAVYSGDSNYPSSTSQPVPVAVRTVPTASVVLTGPSSLGAGANGAFTATLAGNAGAAPTGSVSLFDGNSLLSTAPVANGIANFTASFNVAGTHHLVAAYSGDANYSATTSPLFALQIFTAGFTLETTPSSLTIEAGQSAIATLRLTPTGNYAGNATITCVGLPDWARCSFNPGTVTFDGSNTALTTQFRIDTLGNSSGTVTAQVQPEKDSRNAIFATIFWFPIGVFSLFFGGRRQRMQKVGKLLLLLVVSVGLLTAFAGLSGCGVTKCCTVPNATSGAYSVTVTASGSTSSQSTVFMLNVKQ